VNAWARLALGFVAVVVAAVFLKQLPAVIVLSLLVGGLVVMNARLKPRGSREPGAVDARVLGLEYAAEDPFGLVELPLVLFGRGSDPVASDVLSGPWHGLAVRAFDLSLEVDVPGAGSVRRRLTCAIAPAAASPRFVIEPLWFLLPFPPDAPETMRPDATELASAYTVRSDDPAFAASVLDDRLRRWLVGNDERWAFELGGGVLLAYRPTERGGDTFEALETVRAILDRVPGSVRPG
jgi:hypothetical protein